MGDTTKLYGGFLKWWYPTTMGFPTKNDHFGVFWGYHYLRKHPYPNLWNRPNSPILTFDWSCQMRLRLSCWSRDKSNVLPQWVLKETMCWAIFQFQKNFCNLTLPKTNIAPARKPSQKETSLPTIHFQVLC